MHQGGGGGGDNIKKRGGGGELISKSRRGKDEKRGKSFISFLWGHQKERE